MREVIQATDSITILSPDTLREATPATETGAHLQDGLNTGPDPIGEDAMDIDTEVEKDEFWLPPEIASEPAGTVDKAVQVRLSLSNL